MKTLKITSIALCLCFTVGFAKADKPKNRSLLTVQFSITSFINADTRGNYLGLENVINDDAKFTMMRGDKMLSFTKKQYLGQFKYLKDVQQNCITSYNVLETHSKYALIKVDMKYPTFVRTNYVTMTQCSDGWKITNVISVFSN